MANQTLDSSENRLWGMGLERDGTEFLDTPGFVISALFCI